MMSSPAELRRAILTDYAESVGLPPEAHYYGGARLRPVVPLDAAVGGCLIVGAYPSARFETVGDEHNVPVGDNLGPFEPERYYDGSRVRRQDSASELEEHYLKPLGIDRSECWITDLVKVFLFKPAHREKYVSLGIEPPAGYERERFADLGQRSLPWLHREVAAAKPKLVITLGAEVAGIIRDISKEAAKKLLGPTITPIRHGEVEAPTVHLAHPGIVMRKGSPERNPWPERHAKEHVAALKEALAGLPQP